MPQLDLYFDTLAITTAYRTGHRQCSRDLVNPYQPLTPAHEAYQIGRQEGLEDQRETQLHPSKFAYVIQDELQLCCWGTEEEATEAIEAIEDSDISGLIELPGTINEHPELFPLLEAVMEATANLYRRG